MLTALTPVSVYVRPLKTDAERHSVGPAGSHVELIHGAEVGGPVADHDGDIWLAASAACKARGDTGVCVARLLRVCVRLSRYVDGMNPSLLLAR